MDIRHEFDGVVEKVVVDCRRFDPVTKEMVFDPGQTRQADKESCDINVILSRFERSGVLPELIKKDARYGDFSDVPSYQESLDLVAMARAQFDALDAKVRDRFANDPTRMLEFVNDPANREEMIRLGMAVPKPDKVSPPSPAVPAISQPASSETKPV